MQWIEDCKIEFGKTYGPAVTTIISSLKEPTVIMPLRPKSVGSMVQAAKNMERETQLANGVDPDDIQFDFEYYPLAEIVTQYGIKGEDHDDIWYMSAGLNEDEQQLFQDYLDDIYKSDLKIYREELAEIKKNKKLLFFAIMGRMSENSVDLVKDKAGEEWTRIELAGDPVRLMELVHETHYFNDKNIPAIDRKTAREKLYSLKMKNGESIYSFKKRYDHQIAMCDIAGIHFSDRDIGEMFLEKLSQEYNDLIDEQVRGQQNGTIEYPSSYRDAYDIAYHYQPKRQSQSTSSTVFNATPKSDNSKKTSHKKNKQKKISDGETDGGATTSSSDSGSDGRTKGNKNQNEVTYK
jgi:hypothetical protein